MDIINKSLDRFLNYADRKSIIVSDNNVIFQYFFKNNIDILIDTKLFKKDLIINLSSDFTTLRCILTVSNTFTEKIDTRDITYYNDNVMPESILSWTRTNLEILCDELMS